MAVIGRALLILSLAACVYGIAASLYGARSGRREWVDSGRRSVYAPAIIAASAERIGDLARVSNRHRHVELGVANAEQQRRALMADRAVHDRARQDV